MTDTLKNIIENPKRHRIFDGVADIMKSAEEASKSDDHIAFLGIHSGFPELDHMLGGLQPGKLIVIAGRPAMGKTSFATCIAQHVAIDQGIPSAIFSLEMDASEIELRMLSRESNIDARAIKTGALSEDAWQVLEHAAWHIGTGRLEIIDPSQVKTIEQVVEMTHVLVKELGVKLIVVDYIQLLKSSKTKGGRVEEVSEITRELKKLALSDGITVIALSQLNRELEGRWNKNKRPMLSDLRESGSIEQDADAVIALYRDEVYNKASEMRGIAEVTVLKNRNGACGTFWTLFSGATTSFYSLEKCWKYRDAPVKEKQKDQEEDKEGGKKG